MTIIKSPQMLRDIAAELTKSADEDNPFVRDGDKTYMRFDQIQMERIGIEVVVSYRWRGTLTYTTRTRCNMDVGQILNLDVSQGRILVRAL